ncbi:MAG: EpsI family protein [Chloroflexota bacterium]
MGPFHTDFAKVPMQAGTWLGTDEGQLDATSLRVLKPDSYMQRQYIAPNGWPIYVLVVYGHEKDTFHSPDQCIPGGGRLIKVREKRQIKVNGLKDPVNANIRVYKGDKDQFVALYWFVQDGKTSTSLIPHVWNLMTARIAHRNPTGALVRLIVPFAGDDYEPAVRLAEDLLNQIYPPLDETLRADNRVRSASPTGTGGSPVAVTR